MTVFCGFLNGGFAFFFGADADDFLDIGDENLPVADFAGLGGTDDGPDGAVHPVVRKHDLDLDLGQEIDVVFAAAINFGVALSGVRSL